MRWKRKADPLDRLLNRCVEIDGCWVWRGAKRNGYAAVGIEGLTIYGHRYAYRRFVGDIPDGLVLDHLCRNRACVNPWHLEPVTRGENVRRGERMGSRVAHCYRGHAYTPENTYTNPQGFRACRTCIRARRAAA